MTTVQRSILLTGVASGVTGFLAIIVFLFAPLRTVFVASEGSTRPQQVSILHFSGPAVQLWSSILLCLLLLLSVVAGARMQARGQTTGGSVLLWTATALLGLVIGNGNILLLPLDAFLLPSMALALVSSFVTLLTRPSVSIVGQPNLH